MNDFVHLFGAFAAMFAFVFLKAFQQRNVAFDHYWPVIPISWCMALAEVYVIAVIVRVGYDLPTVFAIGSGSGIGAVAAMLLHRRLFRKRRRGIDGLIDQGFNND